MSGTLSRSYSYDTAGNPTSDGNITYAYNDAGRMVSATKAGVTTTYAHNALGQRVKKTTGGVTRYFVYDEDGHLLGEYDAAGDLIQETIWLGELPVGTLRPNGVGVSLYYIHTDHLNTPRKASRPSDNAIVWRWDSDPFGTMAVNQDPDGDSTTFQLQLRFAGQYADEETGLHYNYRRDFDPQTGRYVQSDPIGLPGGINTYVYGFDDPIFFSDPNGTEVTCGGNYCGSHWPIAPPVPSRPCKCPPVPPAPAGVSCDTNIHYALSNDDPRWFYNQIRNHGPWDYKQYGGQYEAFGNFNFGATGSAFGLTEDVLLRGAGWAQGRAPTSAPGWGSWYGRSPYGDDPTDQAQIRDGIDYFRCKCFR